MDNQKNPHPEEQKKPDSPANASPIQNNLPPNYRPYIPRERTPEYQTFKAKVVSQKGLMITVLSILLAVLFTETIFTGAAGISVPVFAIAYYSVLFYFFRESNTQLNRKALYLTIPVFLLSFSFLLHYNPSTQFITWLTIICIIFMQLVMLGTNPARSLFSFDMLTKVMSNIIGRCFINLGMPFTSLEFLKGRKTKVSKNALLILAGLGISIPVVIILLGLFMSADAVYENAINNMIDFIGFDFGNIFADIFLGFFGGIFLSSILLGLKFEELKHKEVRTVGNSLDSLVIGTFLTMVNILLISFVGFQFMYLFGGTANIDISGLTYAEYARRGFFELAAASGLIFSIALFVLIMTKKTENKLPLWVKLCTVSLCLCNGVLLISALKRMLLYVDVYGLSVKRVLTLWFMCLIGVCLIWMILKCIFSKIDVMKLIGITVITAVCILSLTNTERIIARYNIDRYISNPNTMTLDVYHIGGLSYTIAPELDRLKTLATKDSQFTENDIMIIYKKQKSAFERRNALYGFTLDSIEARKVFSGLGK